MDTAPWPQEFGLMKPSPPPSSIEEMLLVSSSTPTPTPSPCTTRPIPQVVERRGRPQKAQALSCPRCNSTNTKFCYYNNYSLTQPRYFCKTCKRYWTQGGSLRNIPIGGGSRKNKRSFTTSTSHTNSTITTTSLLGSSTSLKKFPDLTTSHVMNPNLCDGQDLNSSFYGENKNFRYPTSTSAMELLSGMSARGLAPFVTLPQSGAMYPTNGLFGVQNIRPTNPLGFPIEGSGVYGNMHGGVQEGGGRVVLPFENLTQVSQDLEQNRGQGGGSSSGLWSGGIRGGTAW